MDKEALMTGLEKALSFQEDYQVALADYRNAVSSHLLSSKHLKDITVVDRIKTMIPEIVITAIFWTFTKGYPTSPLMWALASIGTCVWIYSLIIFFARTKKRFMKTKEYKSRLQTVNDTKEVVKKMDENVRYIERRMQKEVPFLSRQYVYPETLSLLLEYLELGRANDLQEMLNLYETDVKHQELMEANKRIEEEIQMLRNEVGSIYIPTTYY